MTDGFSHAGLRLMIAATRRFREALPFFELSRATGEEIARWTTEHEVVLLDAAGCPMKPRQLHVFTNPWASSAWEQLQLPEHMRSEPWFYDPIALRACDWEPLQRYYASTDLQGERPALVHGFYGMTQQYAQLQLQRQVTCPACLVLYDELMTRVVTQRHRPATQAACTSPSPKP